MSENYGMTLNSSNLPKTSQHIKQQSQQNILNISSYKEALFHNPIATATLLVICVLVLKSQWKKIVENNNNNNPPVEPLEVPPNAHEQYYAGEDSNVK
jgi:hypothetical protein